MKFSRRGSEVCSGGVRKGLGRTGVKYVQPDRLTTGPPEAGGLGAALGGGGAIRADSLLGKAEKVVCRCSRLPEHISVSPRPGPQGPGAPLLPDPPAPAPPQFQGRRRPGRRWVEGQGAATSLTGGPPACHGELTTSQGILESADRLWHPGFS